MAGKYNPAAMPSARLILEDGTVYDGTSFGSAASAVGEVVFNTSLTGYQEIATDPSYRFQIVVMTYPHIGNYGIEASVAQNEQGQVAGFVVRDAIAEPSNALSEMPQAENFSRTTISAIQGMDTRALTRHIRNLGAMRGMITSESDRSVESIVDEIRRAPSMSGLDLVQRVTALRPYTFDEPPAAPTRRIALYDFGVKRDILRHLSQEGCEVTVYPATTHADEILAQNFDGVMLSNGPGDPEPVTYAQENIRHLIGKVPIFGICLGHQLMGLALGAKTYKLKFGHRGGNHPVKQLDNGAIEIPAQNHGFSVHPDALPSRGKRTLLNLYDGPIEGLRQVDKPIFSVQYHPE